MPGRVGQPGRGFSTYLLPGRGEKNELPGACMANNAAKTVTRTSTGPAYGILIISSAWVYLISYLLSGYLLPGQPWVLCLTRTLLYPSVDSESRELTCDPSQG